MCGSCHLDRLSNFEIGIEFLNVCLLFLFFAGTKSNEITQPYLNLGGASKNISYKLKKTQRLNYFDTQHQFQHSIPYPNDMINASGMAEAEGQISPILKNMGEDFAVTLLLASPPRFSDLPPSLPALNYCFELHDR